MNNIFKYSVMVFWAVFMLCVVMALVSVSMMMSNIGSQRLYSQSIDAGVTVATVNSVVNSSVAIANANAAAVSAIANSGSLQPLSTNPGGNQATQSAPQEPGLLDWIFDGALTIMKWLAIAVGGLFVMTKLGIVGKKA